MSVTVKRRITWASIAVDVLLLIAVAVRDSLSPGHWGAGVPAIAFAVTSIVAALLYLRPWRGRS